MGTVMSIITRKANRFNAENRAQLVISRDKPIPSPKYESNVEDMKRTLELDPDFIDKLNTKDAALDSRLKKVYVTSQDSFIEYTTGKKSKSLPLNRSTSDDFEYGYKEPINIAPGRCTLRQAIQFITDHQNNPDKWTVEKIATEYKIKLPVVENILKYYKTFNVYIPDKKYQDTMLTPARNKQLGDPKVQSNDV